MYVRVLKNMFHSIAKRKHAVGAFLTLTIVKLGFQCVMDSGLSEKMAYETDNRVVSIDVPWVESICNA